MRRSTRRCSVLRLYRPKSLPLCWRSRTTTRSSIAAWSTGLRSLPAGRRPTPWRRYHNTRSISASGAATMSASPASTSARGMLSNCAVAGSWATTRPPRSRRYSAPNRPSLPIPDSTMPTPRGPSASPNERKKPSTGSRCPRGAERLVQLESTCLDDQVGTRRDDVHPVPPHRHAVDDLVDGKRRGLAEQVHEPRRLGGIEVLHHDIGRPAAGRDAPQHGLDGGQPTGRRPDADDGDAGRGPAGGRRLGGGLGRGARRPHAGGTAALLLGGHGFTGQWPRRRVDRRRRVRHKLCTEHRRRTSPARASRQTPPARAGRTGGAWGSRKPTRLLHDLLLLLLDLLEVLLEEEALDVAHVHLAALDPGLLHVVGHVQRRAGGDQQRRLLAHL
jgi:hypothetical protein